MKAKVVILIIILFLTLTGSAVYFFFFSPFFISKPAIGKPLITYDENGRPIIKEEHIAFLVNELGGYKLHDDPISNEHPELEVTVDGVKYTTTIVNNHPDVRLGQASNPDAGLVISSKTLASLVESNNLEEDIANSYEAGEIQGQVLTDTDTLVLKGYTALYGKLR